MRKPWAHDTFIALALAQLAMDANRHRLGKIATCLGNVGIGIAHASIFIGRPVKKSFHQ